ncbi:hypothetical protein THMIRHAS_13490 [Thiosulfatimonas sediminis]|uniref:Uncharacterized protein n=2 Tax=Thiosulfatimonas sediminis TaxID=2675054 RepID=A0A6F8PV53_9GAMM|nr:hypothetical protein THMIRHAS_13490 [Thiosulfatimonas sediminis]
MIALSWLAVFFWLEFAFIEKALVDKVFAGHALIVDLVFGLPLVLALAIVIYAMVYWSIKAVCIFLFPALVEPVPQELPSEVQEQLVADAEKEFGEEYWQQPEQQSESSKDKVSTKS